MPNPNDNIKKLEQELIAYCETHSRVSKSRKIRELFETIQYVINNGLSLDHVVSFLNQHDISVSKNTLKVYLYRIRKERGNLPKSKPNKAILKETNHSQIPPISSSDPVESPSTNKETNPYDLMLEEYMKYKNQVDRYIALGGKREDIEDKNISTQRSMVMNP